MKSEQGAEFISELPAEFVGIRNKALVEVPHDGRGCDAAIQG